MIFSDWSDRMCESLDRMELQRCWISSWGGILPNTMSWGIFPVSGCVVVFRWQQKSNKQSGQTVWFAWCLPWNHCDNCNANAESFLAQWSVSIWAWISRSVGQWCVRAFYRVIQWACLVVYKRVTLPSFPVWNSNCSLISTAIQTDRILDAMLVSLTAHAWFPKHRPSES